MRGKYSHSNVNASLNSPIEGTHQHDQQKLYKNIQH